MIDEVIRGALKSIFNGRFFRGTFIQKDGGLPQWPAGRWVVIDSVNEEDICGTDTMDTDETTVQIDVVASTGFERETLQTQVIAAMQGLTPPARRRGLFQTTDEATRTYRTVLEYTFSASSAVTS